MARKKKKGKDAEDDDAKVSEATPQPKGPPKSIWREYFESAVYTAIMFVFFITFIGRTVGVPTGSMQNTIFIGDHFLINKFIFAPGSALTRCSGSGWPLMSTSAPRSSMVSPGRPMTRLMK